MSRKPGSVLAAYLHPGGAVQHSFASALMSLGTYDAAHHGRLLAAGGPLSVRCPTNALVDARNLVVRQFLDEELCEWLWFVDSDMGFDPDALDRLVDAADPETRPVVGALTFGLRCEEPDGKGGYFTRPFPVMYAFGIDPNGHRGFAQVPDYPGNTLVQVAGTGAACLLIHHTAAERLRDKYGDTWFDQTKYPDGRLVSEDLSFCFRLNTAGLPVFVHTGVKTTHAKQIWLSEQDYLDRLLLDKLLPRESPVPPGVQVADPPAETTTAGMGMAATP